MAFGNNTQDKLNEMVSKYKEQHGLVNLEYQQQVNKICYDMGSQRGQKMIELGTLMQGNGVDSVKLNMMNTLIEQNWIIIRELDALNKKLDK